MPTMKVLGPVRNALAYRGAKEANGLEHNVTIRVELTGDNGESARFDVVQSRFWGMLQPRDIDRVVRLLNEMATDDNEYDASALADMEYLLLDDGRPDERYTRAERHKAHVTARNVSQSAARIARDLERLGLLSHD